MRPDDYVEMSATCFIESFHNRLSDRRWLRGASKYFLWKVYGDDEDVDLMRDRGVGSSILDIVCRSQKFAFGSLSQLIHDDHWDSMSRLSDTAIEFYKNGIDIAPYPECWFEWLPWGSTMDRLGIGDSSTAGRVACLVEAGEHLIMFHTFVTGASDRISLSRDPWRFSGSTMWLERDADSMRPCLYYTDTDEGMDSDLNYLDFLIARCALACMAMLMSRDTRIVEKHPPSGLVKHREKKGRVPLFSHKVVTIAPQRIVYQGGDGQQSDVSRASPRLHWRRGHVRTLNTGRKVGIPPCIVGAAENGILDKTYRVNPNP